MRKPSFFPFILLIACSTALGQEWQSFTNSDHIRQIQAAPGSIWGATSGGVVSIELSTGGILKLTNTDGLGGIDFNCAELDSSGDLWFGTSDGWLSVYRGAGDIVNYAVTDISRAVTIYDLFDDGERLWVGNDLGVSKFLKYSNGGEIKDTARRLGNIPYEEDVVCVSVIANNLWAGTPRGIAFIDKDNQNIQYFGFWRSFLEGENGLTDADIRSIAAFNDTVMAGTTNGVFRMAISPDTLWESIGLAGLTINSLVADDSSLLAATNIGIYSYDGISWMSVPSTGLPEADIKDLAIDESGAMWAGTSSSGMARFENNIWTLYSIPGPASNFINDIAIDSGGAVWMTHDFKGISILRDTTWTILNAGNSDLQDNWATAVTVGPDGNVWVGSWGNGLYMYDHNSWYHWGTSNSPMWGVHGNLSYWAASAVQVDMNGIVWVSSLDADSGLIMGAFDPADSIWQIYLTGPNTVTANNTQSMLPQGSMTLWIGMNEGLHRLNFGGTPFYDADDVWQDYISRDFISDMDIDRFGNLWFGTLTGLFYVSSATGIVNRVSIPAELAGRVNTVAIDGTGNIWIGTVSGMGIYRPDINEWRSIYTTSNSPLLNNEVTEIRINIMTGLAYIGTIGGLSIFDSGFEAPDVKSVEAYPNPVNIHAGDNAVYFKRIPPGARVRIYTVSGDLVEEVTGDRWDLLNADGQPISGGIYIFLVESEGLTGTGKFAVIK